MTITNLEVAEAFEQAAENVLAHGWNQGNLGLPGTTQCLDGHLMSVCGFGENADGCFVNPLYSACRRVLSAYIQDHYGPATGSIWVFNDTKVTDAAEARDHLLLAAKELRNNA